MNLHSDETMSDVFEKASASASRAGDRALRHTGMLLACLAVWGNGCAQTNIEFTEVTRIDEKVTEEELARFLRVVDALPDHELPEIPPVFAPPAEWDESRTLTVGGLVAEELNQIEDRWKVDWLVRRLQNNRHLQRAVRQEHLTIEQFVGLYLAIGVALSSTTVYDEHNLDQVLRDGKSAIDDLKKDETAFHSLRPDIMHYVLRQATWITRVDRGKRLKMVPPENRALVRKHLEELTRVFPEEFQVNPLEAVADLLDEQGLPFEELAGMRDADTEWTPERAHIGRDSPDSNSESADSGPSNSGDRSSGDDPAGADDKSPVSGT